MSASSERPIRLLEVVHDYLPEHLGGTEIHAHQMACALSARGHTVRVATTERDLSEEEGTLRRRELDGVDVVELVHQREFATARESVFHPVAPEVFRRVVEEFEPELVHFHHFAHWGAECAELASRAGAATVATLHDFHLICGASTLLRPDGQLCTRGHDGGCGLCLAHLPGVDPGDPMAAWKWREFAADRLEAHRWFLRNVARVVCPSRFLADRMVSAGILREEQVVVMRAGYPGPVHPPRPPRTEGPLRLGYVGGIYPSKGVHVLVDAVASLPPGVAELHVHGILEWFPDYVEDLRLRAEGAPVTFHGRFQPSEVDSVLQSLDALVVPSIWYENMPITIQEAYRNALPVIATRLGGMAEAIRDGVDGVLFERGDVAELASVIRRLAEDRDELARLAEGRPAVPTVEGIATELEALYRDVLGERAQ